MNISSISSRVASPDASDWLDEAEVAKLTPAMLVERAREIRDLAASFAQEAERMRRPADAVISAMRRAGIFYHFVPARYGGREFGLQTFIDIVTTVAEGCASSAWVMSFYMQHNLLLSQFPLQAQEEIFSKYPYVLAPVTTAPPGKAVPVDGGYRLSGYWKYTSGVVHANWLMLAAFVERNNVPAEMRLFMLPVEQARVIDKWYVDGLAATGSQDVAVDNLIVPEHLSMEFEKIRSGVGHGKEMHQSHLFSLAVDVLLNVSSSSPAIGAARACVGHFRKRLLERSPIGADGKPDIRPSSMARLAEATLAAETAELLLREAADRAEAAARARQTLTAEQRLRIRSHIVYAVKHAKKAVQIVSDAAGTSAHSLDNPIQRAVRDVVMISSHTVYDWDIAMDLLGRVLTDTVSENMLLHHSAGQVG